MTRAYLAIRSFMHRYRSTNRLEDVGGGRLRGITSTACCGAWISSVIGGAMVPPETNAMDGATGSPCFPGEPSSVVSHPLQLGDAP
jgi:hypothetical protein